MALFDQVLGANESLFVNELALDFDYLPPVIKFREEQQQAIASCIKPIFAGRHGRNVVIVGSPGIGKSAAVRAVLREVEKESEDIYCVYVNCWKKESAFKVAADICEQVGYTWVHNKRSDELFAAAAAIVNRKSCVLVLDEADKLTDLSALYAVLEDFQRKCIILVTNNPSFLAELDARVRSRLMPSLLEFKPYTFDETLGILQQRVEYAFAPSVFDGTVLRLIAKKTFELTDVRAGLFFLREAGSIAENAGLRKIQEKHAVDALTKLPDFKMKKLADLDAEERQLLDLVKVNTGKTTSEVFLLYQQKGGGKSFRTFQRKIKDLVDGNFIVSKEINKGSDEGRATVLEFSTTLEDFQ